MGRGFGSVFEEVVCSDEGEGFGLGLDEPCACGVDALDARLSAGECVGLEDLGELVEGELVERAQVEC